MGESAFRNRYALLHSFRENVLLKVLIAEGGVCVLVSEARSAQGARKGLGMRLHCSYQSLAQEVGGGV